MTMVGLKVVAWMGLLAVITIGFGSHPSFAIPWFIAFALLVGGCLNFIEKHEQW